MELTHGGVFCGIGGFHLAAQWAGWENIFHCEINDFGSKILKYYWPNAKSYKDITKTDFNVWRGKLDVFTGGFPCQPFSHAGKRSGSDDDRFLWPEMFRAIQEIQPPWIVAENVPGILTIEGGVVFHSVCTQMESEGYQVQPFNIPACATDADHERQRIWFVAYCDRYGQRRRGLGESQQSIDHKGEAISKEWEQSQPKHSRHSEYDSNPESNRFQNAIHGINTNKKNGSQSGRIVTGTSTTRESWFEAATRLCIVDDGLSGRLDGITVSKWKIESLKAAGNAIRPQVAYQIFKSINDYYHENETIVSNT